MTDVTAELLRDWPLPDPGDGGDKHDRGTVLVVGGAVSTPGAVLLAGLAALRVGAGRLQVATVAETSVALGVALPEAKVIGLTGARELGGDAGRQLRDEAEHADAVVIGPGLLDAASARELLAELLPACRAGIVLDAVALSALGADSGVLDGVRERVVLTPNAREAGALLGRDEAPEDEATARAIAQRHGALVTLRGWTVDPDGGCWHDETGDVGLGTSGSGDVLAGAVAGLLARGADPAQAAVWGAHLHAAAGDGLAARLGRLGYLARELLDELPLALRALAKT
jgi:hydroxyethylthiazole kinase-like uncharacterized protein yjeF